MPTLWSGEIFETNFLIMKIYWSVWLTFIDWFFSHQYHSRIRNFCSNNSKPFNAQPWTSFFSSPSRFYVNPYRHPYFSLFTSEFGPEVLGGGSVTQMNKMTYQEPVPWATAIKKLPTESTVAQYVARENIVNARNAEKSYWSVLSSAAMRLF